MERLLDDLRRLVREGRELEQEAAGAALDANREEAERLRWRLATMVKSTVRRGVSGEGLRAGSLTVARWTHERLLRPVAWPNHSQQIEAAPTSTRR